MSKHFPGAEYVQPFEYDTRQIICPNASLTGYGTCKARVGSWITWDSDDDEGIGRVLGRAIRLQESGGQDVKGWAVVLMLSVDHTHAFIRFVKPEWITRVETRPHRHLLEWFIQDKLPPLETTVRMACYGTLSDSYIALDSTGPRGLSREQQHRLPVCDCNDILKRAKDSVRVVEQRQCLTPPEEKGESK